MRHILIVLCIGISSFLGHAQTYEIGAFLGGANYIGDVGSTNYINPTTLAVGGILKWNRSERHAFRATIIHSRISGDDAKATTNSRKERGLTFNNTINEFSLGIEYTFWEYDVHSGKTVSAPYLYTGLTYFTYNALFKDTDNSIEEYDGGGTAAIPMVLGFKTTVSTAASLGFEIGARYTFTDGLDGSNPIKGLSDNESVKFGNQNNNDWYVFTGVTLSFTFGRKPCYCNF